MSAILSGKRPPFKKQITVKVSIAVEADTEEMLNSLASEAVWAIECASCEWSEEDDYAFRTIKVQQKSKLPKMWKES